MTFFNPESINNAIPKRDDLLDEPLDVSGIEVDEIDVEEIDIIAPPLDEEPIPTNIDVKEIKSDRGSEMLA